MGGRLRDDGSKGRPRRSGLPRTRKLPSVSNTGNNFAADGTALIDGRPWHKAPELKTAFASLQPFRGQAECMLHVYWSGYAPPAPDGTDVDGRADNPHMPRGRVTADLGFVPEPPFTNAEMQDIMLAAKMGAFKVMQGRAKIKRLAEKAARSAAREAKARKGRL